MGGDLHDRSDRVPGIEGVAVATCRNADASLATPERRGGADRFFVDKHATRYPKRHLGGDRGLRLIEHWLDVYAVVSDDGRVATVAYQSRRFRRP